MANDINMPNFNLGDDLDSWKSDGPVETPKEEKSEDKGTAKPRLLFEDNLEEKGEPMSPESGKEKPSKSKPKESSDEKKGSKKNWLWITLALIVIIAGGVFFLHTQGYLNLSNVLAKLDKIKTSIFGGKSDTTQVQIAAVPDTTKIAQAAVADTLKEKSEPTVKLTPEKKENLEPEKTPEKPKEAPPKEKSQIDKNKLLKAPVKPDSRVRIKIEPKKPAETKKPPVTKAIEKPKTTIKKEPSKNVSRVNLPVQTGNFSVQVSAWKKKGKANLEAGKLKTDGFKAFVLPVILPDKGGTWYRVMIGGYQTSKEAEDQLAIVKQKLNVDGIIREK